MKSGNVLIGEVIEHGGGINYRVKLEDGREVRMYLGGKMRVNRITVLVGDKVSCELPDGSPIGRIIRRL